MKSKILKQIPIEQLMDLKIDYAFKQLFGKEKNKDITVVFLNAILQKTGRNTIKDISFGNTEAGGEYADDKKSRLDLLVTTDDDEAINVEIQFTNKHDMIKRSLYYWAGTYRSPLKKGMAYQELRPVIAINILNFNLYSETDRFHTSHRLYEDEEKFPLTDVMEFHFIEMSKLNSDWKADKLDPWNDVLVRWLMMLGMVDRRNNKIYDDIYKELEEIAMKDDTLYNAFNHWEELSSTKEQRVAYEERTKEIMDEEAAKREFELRAQEAEERGEKRGEKRGEERGEIKGQKKSQEAIARKLIAEELDLDLIVKTTGLDKEKVIEMQREVEG